MRANGRAITERKINLKKNTLSHVGQPEWAVGILQRVHAYTFGTYSWKPPKAFLCTPEASRSEYSYLKAFFKGSLDWITCDKVHVGHRYFALRARQTLAEKVPRYNIPQMLCESANQCGIQCVARYGCYFILNSIPSGKF